MFVCELCKLLSFSEGTERKIHLGVKDQKVFFNIDSKMTKKMSKSLTYYHIFSFKKCKVINFYF